MNEQNNKRFKQMLAVAAILGVLSSAVVYNVMTTRAFNVSGAFPAEGLGENGDLAGQCQFMFDTYLLNTNVWKNRISNFAKAFFQQIIGQAYTRAWCSIPEFEKCKEVGGSLVISFKVNLCIRTPRPSCDVGKGDIMTSAMFEDIAERSLLYDQVANCQAWAMTNGIMDAAQQTYNENGRDGGSTAIRDYKQFLTESEARGYAIARNIFANTRYCPWIQKEMEAIFNFDPDLAIPIPTNTDSGIEPYVQKAECTFSDDVDIFAVMRDPVARRELDKPQNNLFGAYLLAKQEIDRQISLELNADKTNAEANDGNLGTSGTTAEESCVEGYFDEQGICQQYVPNNTAGWLINQNVADANKAELDLIVNGNTMGGLLADMRHRILARMQNFAYSQVDVLFSRDWSTELYQDSDPGDPSEQNQTDPDNENCGMPSTTECTCTINDPQAQTIGQNLVSEMQQVARENPQLFVNGDPGSGQLIPGANVEFINKLCLALQLDNDGCRAYVPRADDVILLPLGGGNTAAIDIITAPERGNRLRSTPATKYVCPHSAY